MMQVDKVLMLATIHFQIWAKHDGLYAVMADGSIRKKEVPHADDLFALPFYGLSQLAIEYLDELRERLHDPR